MFHMLEQICCKQERRGKAYTKRNKSEEFERSFWKIINNNNKRSENEKKVCDTSCLSFSNLLFRSPEQMDFFSDQLGILGMVLGMALVGIGTGIRCLVNCNFDVKIFGPLVCWTPFWVSGKDKTVWCQLSKTYHYIHSLFIWKNV